MLATNRAVARPQPVLATCPVACPRNIQRLYRPQASFKHVLGHSSSLSCRAACTGGSAGAPTAPSTEERRNTLRQLIDTAAAKRQVAQDAIAVLTEEKLQQLVELELFAESILLNVTYDELVQAKVLPGVAKAVKMLFPSPTGGMGGSGPVSSAGATSMIGPSDEGSLLQQAPSIAEANGIAGAWRLSGILSPDGSFFIQGAGLYMDPQGVVHDLQRWAETCVTQLSDPPVDRATFPAVMIVSGLTKTGKSFTINSVIPAILAHSIQRANAVDPLLKRFAMLRVDACLLDMQDGASGLLCCLLRTLLTSLLDTHVPVKQDAIDRAQRVLATTKVEHSSRDVFAGAIIKLMHAVEVPVLVLLDEAQSLFLTTLGGQPDKAGTEFIRDSVLKRLLLYGNPKVLWCITGSSMSLTWLHIADMAPNAYTLFTGVRSVHLPATFGKEDMMTVRRELEPRFSQNPLVLQQLFEVSEPTPALLTTLVQEYVRVGQPPNINEFASKFVETKLVQEARREWAAAFAYLTPKQRILLYDLACPWVGVPKIKMLPSGLIELLKPHLTSADGRALYLKSAHHRQIIKLVIGPDGCLLDHVEGLDLSASLTQVEGADMLIVLGETADYLFGAQKKRRNSSMPLQNRKLRSCLQTLLVEPLCSRVPWQKWPEEPWFVSVLESRWNSSDRRWLANNRAMLRNAFDMLVFYLRLSRNVLSHRKAGLEDVKAVTRDTVMALPTFLEMDAGSFLEGLARALGMLDRATVLAAAAAMKQEDEEVEEEWAKKISGSEISEYLGSSGRDDNDI